jgi:hypothetical protein
MSNTVVQKDLLKESVELAIHIGSPRLKWECIGKMQTICKAVRKQAVCGQKPGGSSAYNLRESCVKKDAPARAPRVSRNSPESVELKKIKGSITKLLKFYMSELKELNNRFAVIANVVANFPANFTAGNDHNIASIYIESAQRQQATSVHARIKKACAEFNLGRTNPIVLNQSLERLVISGAMKHFQSAFKELTRELSQ